jgi:hypothetical protein
MDGARALAEIDASPVSNRNAAMRYFQSMAWLASGIAWNAPRTV